MYILVPESRERIWGTPRLHAYSGDPQIEKIGSVYSASAIAGIDCKVVGQDASFSELVKEKYPLFGLEKGMVYPLIISFTACDEHLSIQVHPTDSYAQKNEQMPYGKSEAWYFLTPPDSNWIYAEQQVPEKQAILHAVQENKYDEVLREYPVSAEDLIYIPSGTIHALTKGAFVYEIQQATDITYRFYDYDRTDKDGEKRTLHVEKAVDTLIPEQHVEKSSFAVGETVAKREFSISHLKGNQTWVNDTSIAVIGTVVSGELVVEEAVCQVGQSVVLLPGERLVLTDEVEVIVAIPNIYWK